MVFDLDGTLLDHVGSVTAALGNWLPTLGAAPSAAMLAAWFAAEERHFPAWRAQQISFTEQRRRRLRDFLPLIGVPPGDDGKLDHIFAGYLTCYEAAWTKFDDVDPVLTELTSRGLRTAVLTNGATEQQTAKLRAVGLGHLLDTGFTAEAIGVAKPDPQAYLSVCADLHVTPQSAVHVGDRYDLDVTAPRAAGLRAIHLDRNGSGPPDEPHRITSLQELPHQLDHRTDS